MKRIIDILISSIFLFISLPLLLFICIINLILNKGKILFLQDRTGYNGTVFKIIKFKTMNDKTNSDRELRRELREMNSESTDQLRKTLESLGQTQAKHLEDVSKKIEKLKDRNEKKLDQMREVVDEKLQTTLEKRIGESFKLVSERLEAVQRGLGEMQSLASDASDLKKVLTKIYIPPLSLKTK